MSLVQSIVIGLLMGTVFGVALEKARVFEPGMIVGQMQLRNFIMLKVFLTAVATGAVVIAALHGFGLVKLAPKATFYAADVVGGLMLGAGIALAGACPGTVLAQVGVGYRDALFTLLGGIAGATAFGYAEPVLKPVLMASGPGKITFMDLTGLSYPVLAVGLAVVLVVILVGLEVWRPWRADLGADVDGDFGPAAPAKAARAHLEPAE
ncbi:YeeE/YedE thiosulfate transporter family protein [Xanthobacter flavus]|uniref:YeeE/YedE thiosulfate transporter family protein n=1 Tax=Xanthobacter flavus TaxID=281 RepID=UPI001AEA391E|nr:YeeE/YedE thiosulfate transporter family protein [Xanthobacter flavus]MBP2148927.1 putative membrane protein YedE/YeeE [Xanthobacter flavus]